MKLLNSNNHQLVSLKHVSKGVYLVVINSNARYSTQKIIIE